jgi:hypothetical protein
MGLHDSPADAAFCHEVRSWVAEHLVKEFAEARGVGGPGREHPGLAIRQPSKLAIGPCRAANPRRADDP